MIAPACPARCPGTHGPEAICCGLCGMGMVRPRRSAESDQHRPSTSSTRTVTDGSEGAKQRQTPYPHWTRAICPAAACTLPLRGATRCRWVPSGSEATAMNGQPNPRSRRQAQPPQGCVYVPRPATVGRLHASSQSTGEVCPEPRPQLSAGHGKKRRRAQRKQQRDTRANASWTSTPALSKQWTVKL